MRWANSAYELGIEALEEAGFVEIDPACGRIYAKVLPKARKFEAWMEIHERRKQVQKAQHELAKFPGHKPETLAMLYNITLAELMSETPPRDELKQRVVGELYSNVPSGGASGHRDRSSQTACFVIEEVPRWRTLFCYAADGSARQLSLGTPAQRGEGEESGAEHGKRGGLGHE